MLLSWSKLGFVRLLALQHLQHSTSLPLINPDSAPSNLLNASSVLQPDHARSFSFEDKLLEGQKYFYSQYKVGQLQNIWTVCHGRFPQLAVSKIQLEYRVIERLHTAYSVNIPSGIWHMVPGSKMPLPNTPLDLNDVTMTLDKALQLLKQKEPDVTWTQFTISRLVAPVGGLAPREIAFHFMNITEGIADYSYCYIGDATRIVFCGQTVRSESF